MALLKGEECMQALLSLKLQLIFPAAKRSLMLAENNMLHLVWIKQGGYAMHLDGSHYVCMQIRLFAVCVLWDM